MIRRTQKTVAVAVARLLPCPFCGKKKLKYVKVDRAEELLDPDPNIWWRVECQSLLNNSLKKWDSCLAKGPFACSRKEARDNWNTRRQPTRITEPYEPPY